MIHPWMQFWTRDWLDNKELRRCSPAARAVLADLMCIAHEGYPYGYLADKVGPLTEDYLASRCVLPVDAFRSAIAELRAAADRIAVSESGTIYVPRMVEDAKIRKKRSEGGRKGGNPKLLKGKVKIEVNQEGYPEVKPRSDSDSNNNSEVPKKELPKNFPPAKRPENAASFENLNEAWKWYVAEYPAEVNEFVDRQLFLSVVETDEDIAALRKNLPLWKQTKRWRDGFYKESKNFLSERVFKVTPKPRDADGGVRPPVNLNSGYFDITRITAKEEPKIEFPR